MRRWLLLAVLSLASSPIGVVLILGGLLLGLALAAAILETGAIRP